MEEDFRTKEETVRNRRKNIQGFIIALVIIIVLSVIIIPNILYGRIHYPFQSCLGNCRNMGIIINNYSSDHKGHYPQNLEVLIEQRYLESLPTCPATDKGYIYQVDSWDSENFTISCPNPEEHHNPRKRRKNIKSIFYSALKGPLIIYEDK